MYRGLVCRAVCVITKFYLYLSEEDVTHSTVVAHFSEINIIFVRTLIVCSCNTEALAKEEFTILISWCVYSVFIWLRRIISRKNVFETLHHENEVTNRHREKIREITGKHLLHCVRS